MLFFVSHYNPRCDKMWVKADQDKDLTTLAIGSELEFHQSLFINLFGCISLASLAFVSAIISYQCPLFLRE